jgi:hypothetical protein
VASCISDPVKIRKQEEEIRRLQEEVDRVKAELLVLKENSAAACMMAEESHKIAERVKATFGETGTAATKAKLFDEKMHEEKKLSGSRMIRILSDFTEQVEAVMREARTAADLMEESSRLVLGATCSRGIQLSDLLLPNSFLDAAA